MTSEMHSLRIVAAAVTAVEAWEAGRRPPLNTPLARQAALICTRLALARDLTILRARARRG